MTPWTTDLHKVASDTDAIFPDWNQPVDRIRGGEDWAVFEWTGTGTFNAGEGKAGIPIEMTGATVIDVDADGKVTAWRDYLDTNEPTQQIQNGLERALEGAEPTRPPRAQLHRTQASPLGRHRLHVGQPGVTGLVELLRRLLVVGHLGVDVGVGQADHAHRPRRRCAAWVPTARCRAGWARSA